MAAIFVYSFARGAETEHYKIKQPNKQKSPLLQQAAYRNFSNPAHPRTGVLKKNAIFVSDITQRN